jgi:predicted permease
VRLVHGDYFGTLGLPMREGRALTATDTEAALPVAVVNERMAREFWPGRSPVGERLSFAWTDEPHWMTVVGVAGDLKGTQVTAQDSLTVYAPYVQRVSDWQRWGTLVVRTRVEPHSLTRPLKEAVWSVDPTLTPDQVVTVEDRRAEQTAQQRFNALALVSFAAVALLVALQGVYALLAYAVEERRREIGVRMALGATGGDVLRLVLGRGLRLAALGLAGGLVLAFSLGRTLESLLFGVAPTDALTFLAAASLLGVTALVACTLPAWRASRVDPIAVLRSE